MTSAELQPPTSQAAAAELCRHLRVERDRYVAFAFAAADLLIELSHDGNVVAASGAAQAVLGIGIRELNGRAIMDSVATADRPLVLRLLKQVQTLYRTDPAVVCLARKDGGTASVLFGLCRLPDRAEGAFLSIALLPDAMIPIDRPRDTTTGLLTPDALREAAQRLGGTDHGDARQLQLVRLDGLSGAARRLPAARADVLMHEIAAALRASSIGGDAAGRLGDDAFAVVTKAGQAPRRAAALMADLTDAIREAGIPADKVGPRIARINLTLGDLSDNDAGRALTYAMTQFVRSPAGTLDIASLQEGLAAAMHEAVSRVAQARRMLDDERFAIVFQPVVELKTRATHHFEVLSRFPEGTSTFETVVLSENIGLSMDLDLIVCRRAIAAMEHGGTARVAVNLSGRSVQNEAFRDALFELTATLGDSRPRLLFELTEWAMVEDMEAVGAFLSCLRSLGHAVCLDDFGAGAAAYGYLRRFDVDFVKIDGPFLKAAGERGRERALIRSVCGLCNELSCKVIGEMIEDEDTAALAASLGIGFGQGWLFGKPVTALPMPPRSGRRRGTKETWE